MYEIASTKEACLYIPLNPVSTSIIIRRIIAGCVFALRKNQSAQSFSDGNFFPALRF